MVGQNNHRSSNVRVFLHFYMSPETQIVICTVGLRSKSIYALTPEQQRHMYPKSYIWNGYALLETTCLCILFAFIRDGG